MNLAVCTQRIQITAGVGKLVSGGYGAKATLKSSILGPAASSPSRILLSMKYHNKRHHHVTDMCPSLSENISLLRALVILYGSEVIFDWLYDGGEKRRLPPQHLVSHHHPTRVEEFEHLGEK